MHFEGWQCSSKLDIFQVGQDFHSPPALVCAGEEATDIVFWQ